MANLESNKKITADALLYAVGRKGNVDGLNLEAAGIQSDTRGRIAVDKNYHTSQPDVFAAGDVIISTSDEIGIIGAAVNAERAAFGSCQG